MSHERDRNQDDEGSAPAPVQKPWRSAADLRGGRLPFAPACERNRDPILQVLRDELGRARRVLEIGSGTGQHAVHFARELPHLTWQTSDLGDNHAAIRAWIEQEGLANVAAPIELDVQASRWPAGPFDAVFSANTAHIMSWPQVQAMIAGIGRVLGPDGVFLLYGPFAYDGVHVSASNADFDAMLRARDPHSGVRDVRDLEREANAANMELCADHAMPANNRTLVWRKK
ncbi:MAG TPA: DUF938 domain-containing protein [Candidatus Binatia bacterium]|nr:DUF938 domain-containing protein [Candidatus Binatia bacterium]